MMLKMLLMVLGILTAAVLGAAVPAAGVPGDDEVIPEPTVTVGDWWAIRGTMDLPHETVTEVNATIIARGTDPPSITTRLTTTLTGGTELVQESTTEVDVTGGQVRVTVTDAAGGKWVSECITGCQPGSFGSTPGERAAGTATMRMTIISPSGDSQSSTFETDWTVEVVGRETVTVEAGTFDTLHVVTTHGVNTTETWYAPEALANVKSISRVGDGVTFVNTTGELVDYQVETPGSFVPSADPGPGVSPGPYGGNGGAGPITIEGPTLTLSILVAVVAGSLVIALRRWRRPGG